jgi:hypothetical protein
MGALWKFKHLQSSSLALQDSNHFFCFTPKRCLFWLLATVPAVVLQEEAQRKELMILCCVVYHDTTVQQEPNSLK